MNDEKLKAANQNRRRKSEIEKEFEIWERELTEPRKLGYLQGWNKDHPVALNSCVSEELFNGFRLAVMNELRLKLNQLDAEFSIL